MAEVSLQGCQERVALLCVKQGRTGHTCPEEDWHAVLVRKVNPCWMQTAVDCCRKHAGTQHALHLSGGLKSALAWEAKAQRLPQSAPGVAQAYAGAQLRADGLQLA